MGNWRERELEDYVSSHFDEVFSLIDNEHTVKLLGRQIRCRYGIIDLLAYQDSTLFVVELKAVKADDNTAGQLLRYQRALSQAETPSAWTLEMVDLYPILFDFPIYTIAIAPSFTDRALHAIDTCIVAEKTNDGFSFSKPVWPKGDRDASKTLGDTLRPYFDSLLGTEMTRYKRHGAGILEASAERRLREVN